MELCNCFNFQNQFVLNKKIFFSRTFSFNGVERACQEGGGVVREAQRGAGQDQRVAQHQQVSSTLSLSLSLLLTMVTQTAPVGAKNSPPSSSRIHHDWLQHFHWQFFSPAIHTTLLGFGNMKVLKLNLEVRLIKSWRYGWISRLLQYFFFVNLHKSSVIQNRCDRWCKTASLKRRRKCTGKASVKLV